MSSESLRAILGRAVAEPEYRDLLLYQPEQALAGYDLSETEAASLKGLTAEGFDALSCEVEPRQSRISFSLNAADQPKLAGLSDAPSQIQGIVGSTPGSGTTKRPS